ncbi:MAG: FAD-dependent oxidoreductase [Deltaproteobacteria bacterium]|nr:FAD-dependent oxidoreductase [Deltaproteobacteria bacterium]
MDAKKIVVIGGSAAGPKVAAKARRLDMDAKITLIQKSPDLSMASCGYPYYVGGFFDDRNMLLSTPTGVTRDPGFFKKAKNVTALTSTEAVEIDRAQKRVCCQHLPSGDTQWIDYDKLIVCTGATAKKPPVSGIELDGVTTLVSIQDADYLRRIRDEKKIHRAVVVGGGLIGIETCEALRLAGIEVTIVEMLPQILTFLSSDLSRLVANHLQSKKVHVIRDNGVSAFIGENGKLSGVKLQNGTELPCELAVVAIGVTPNVALAQKAGLKIGDVGGIVVDKYMQTSDPDIYAAGDCVETRHILTGKQVHAPFGDLANLQGRVAAANCIHGNHAEFKGTILTGICQVFDYAAGATGINEATARAIGLDAETIINASPDKPGFMQGKLLVSKLIVDKKSRRLLGYQSIGPGDVSKQIASAAMAITGGMTVDDIAVADMPYAPPFSLAIDHFIASAHIMQNKLDGHMQGVTAAYVKERLCCNEPPFLLDARGPDEYEQMRLGIGEVLIPLGALRQRLDELPQDRSIEIICFCKISLRGYEAALILQHAGYTNVKVMEGGIMAWSYPREL